MPWFRFFSYHDRRCYAGLPAGGLFALPATASEIRRFGAAAIIAQVAAGRVVTSSPSQPGDVASGCAKTRCGLGGRLDDTPPGEGADRATLCLSAMVPWR